MTTPELAVSLTGSDASRGRSADPFATFARALASLLKNLPSALRLSFGAGAHAGASIVGFSGGGYLRGGRAGLTLEGSYSAASLASGSANGTAGSGTSETSLAKPTGAEDWTASDLVGRMLRICGGGGFDENATVLRPILANTVSTLTVYPVSGMDETTEFELVELESSLTVDPLDPVGDGLTALFISDNKAPVIVRGMLLDTLNVVSRSNSEIVFDGCVFSGGCLIDSSFDDYVSFKNCLFLESSTAGVEDCGKEISAEGCLFLGGQLDIRRAQNVRFTGEAQANVLNTLSVIGASYVQAQLNASDCTATPIYLEAVGWFQPLGTGLTGTNAAGTYGLEIQKGGRYNVTGASISGALGDVKLGPDALTWAALTSIGYGVAMRYGATLIAEANENKAIVQGNYLHSGNVDIAGRLLLYGYLNQATKLSGISAAGSSASDATDLASEGAFGFAAVTVVGAGQGVLLPPNAAIAGHCCVVYNGGANALLVYPPSGGTLNGDASVSVGVGKIAVFWSLNGASGKDYCGAVLP